MNISIEGQGLKATDPWSKAIQPLPLTMPEEEAFLDNLLPPARVELNKKSDISFCTLSDAMWAVRCINDTAFWQPTESHELEIWDSLNENKDVIISDLLYNVQSKSGKGNFVMMYPSERISKISLNFARRLGL